MNSHLVEWGSSLVIWIMIENISPFKVYWLKSKKHFNIRNTFVLKCLICFYWTKSKMIRLVSKEWAMNEPVMGGRSSEHHRALEPSIFSQLRERSGLWCSFQRYSLKHQPLICCCCVFRIGATHYIYNNFLPCGYTYYRKCGPTCSNCTSYIK